jgi:hypothetical protein
MKLITLFIMLFSLTGVCEPVITHTMSKDFGLISQATEIRMIKGHKIKVVVTQCSGFSRIETFELFTKQGGL